MIVIHCSDTHPSQDIHASDIDRWHREERGWDAIGYAYVIPRDGTLELGRDLDGDGDVCDEVGAHAAGFNTESVGICLVGGRDIDGNPEFNFTFRQMKMLNYLCIELESQFPTITATVGHNDLPGVTKKCPCFNVYEWFHE
jgi:N-acetylmuramoyl-L-alanine amidase